ncbi:MAG: glycosyltransferase 87 family protein [Acidimicrobiales bacterium]
MDGDRRWVVLGALVATASVAAYLGVLHWHSRVLWTMYDLEVYRGAGQAAGPSVDIYELRLGELALPFTYTPFAALVFTPLRLLDWTAARTLATAANLAAVFLAAVLSLRLARCPTRAARRGLAGPALIVGAVCLWTEPVQQTLRFGQVNLLLLVAVLLDLSLPDSSRGKGALIGLATAVKLTPAVFVAYLVLTGRRTAALRAVAVVVATIVVSAVLLPSSSWSYWTNEVYGAGRIGNPDYLTNQSIKGALTRAFGEGPPTTALWLATSIVVLVAGLRWAMRLRISHSELAGALAAAVTALLVSPISWSHHWVWVIAAVALGTNEIARHSERRIALLGSAAVVGLFASWWFERTTDPALPLGVLWLAPSGNHAERHWTLLQALTGNAYVLTAGAVIALAAVRQGRVLVRSVAMAAPAHHGQV